MKRLLSAALGRVRPADPWCVSVENPQTPVRLDPLRLFAILGTWMEEDVVATTVRNAFAQGCERVYLVDNGSTDETVARAVAAGATLARSFTTARYDETERLRHMNEVVAEVSEGEGAEHIWWLFLDADEFPHGPFGMTVRDYLATLDRRFRVVGARFFDHYPSGAPQFVPDRHPLDFQPLCHEVPYPMCRSRHRKHSLQRWDRGGAPIWCREGFHLAECDDPLFEPRQPIFLHHFPYRDERVARERMERLWTGGDTRALVERDTHMLARSRSLDAVYRGDWKSVHNFMALAPTHSLRPRPRRTGVKVAPWSSSVPAEHQHFLRWYSSAGVWNYGTLPRFSYGDDTTYQKGMSFLDGHGTIEDWGCGFAHARSFVHTSPYVGVDGSSPHADRIVDLATYRSRVECVFMRHVIEHNANWRGVLTNALASFERRMALILFTPFVDATRVIDTTGEVTSVPVPDIAFRKSDLTELFGGIPYREESLRTDTKYKTEHIFYLEK